MGSRCDNFCRLSCAWQVTWRTDNRREGRALISLDISIIPAIFIFLGLIYALNRLLFRPLLRVQAERESRTTGLIEKSRGKLSRQLQLFEQYQAAIRKARMDGYRHQEQVRSEAMQRRAEALVQARKDAESLIGQSGESLQAQVAAGKDQLARDAGEISRGIAATILQRSA